MCIYLCHIAFEKLKVYEIPDVWVLMPYCTTIIIHWKVLATEMKLDNNAIHCNFYKNTYISDLNISVSIENSSNLLSYMKCEDLGIV